MRELLAHVQFRGGIRDRSVDPVLGLLKAVGERRRFRGVLLEISSGGGGSVPSAMLFRAVRRLDATKPVVAWIGSVGASGGYLAAIGARQVLAHPDAAVGSIGVVYPHLAVARLLDRLGIDVELLHEGRHKDAYQGLRSLTDEERAKLQAVAHENYESFVQTVAEARRRPVEEIRALATGEFWSGRRAAQLGLVDGVADRDEALESLARLTGVPSKRTVLVAPPRPLIERFVGSVGRSVALGASGALREAFEESVGDLRG